jgi:hypothetical protein
MTAGWRRLPLISLALVSGAALGYQVLLLRVFSIVQWHHLAYMVISLALLGYGASGTALTLGAPWVRRQAGWLYPWSILLFALASLPAFLLAQALAFSPEELLWRPSLAWRLAAIYVVLATPFFLAASAVGIAFLARPGEVPRLYAADLAGAGAGGLAALGTMYAPSPASGLVLMATVGLMGALVAVVELRRARVSVLAASGLAVAVSLLLPADTLVLRPSPYKDLEETLRIAGTRIEAQRTGPRGQVTAVGSPLVPLREAPGMSLVAGVEPPPQRALFVNGDGITGITQDDGRPDALAFLDRLPSALPYHLLSPDRVLVPRADGGLLALQAKTAGASRVDALVPDPNVLALVRGPYADFSGGLYLRPPVRAIRADARAFLERTDAVYDLIQIAPPGSQTAGGAGLHAIQEDFLYTVEALGTAWRRLSPEGALAVSAWIRLPPRDSLKLAAMLVVMLDEAGVADPGAHLAVVRAWQMATFVVTRAPLPAPAIPSLRRFAEARGFDLAWYPGMERSAANRYNRMPEPYLFDGIARMLAEGPASLISDYKFDLRPATDDRPFFHNFLRWRSLPEVAGLLGAGGMPLLEAGFVLLLATLAQALLLAATLILLPLLLSRRRRHAWAVSRLRGKVLIYFSGLGLAFMIVELVALHRLVLLVGSPVITSAVVLAFFLLAAGAGSLRAARACDLRHAIRTAVAGTVVAALAWHGLLALFAPALSSQPPLVAAGVAAASLAPMAFFMGQLFPLGLTAVARRDEGMIAWAWGINGCASVVGAIAGTALAVSIGFGASLIVALAIYAVVAASVPHPPIVGPPSADR